jgi:DNA-binding IclR family transcriptional regulator
MVDEEQSSGKGESLLVRKAITVLRLFGGNVKSLGLQDVVAATGYSKTVCHRLLSTLVSERFLVQFQGTARYSLGPDLITLARSNLSHEGLLVNAEPALSSIARETGDVAILYVLDGVSALCIDRRDGDYPIRTAGVAVGGRLPLHCGGGPMALLSFAPADVVNRVLEGPLEAATPRTEINPDRIRHRIEQVRERGYAIGDEDLFEFVVAIGAPIFYRGNLVAALSVGGIKPRYDKQRIEEVGRLALAGAEEVARRLDGD